MDRQQGWLMDDSKDISFSTLTDTISVQDYDYQTIDLRSAISNIDLTSGITMASPTYTISGTTTPMPTINLGGTGATGPGHANSIWTTGTAGWNGMNAADLNQSGMLSLKGENADIDINGKSLMKTLEALEDRLNMLVPNSELEKEWDDLKKLGDRYRKLEKKCKEKANMWTKLKAMPKIKL
jgi:hypothetical protein